MSSCEAPQLARIVCNSLAFCELLVGVDRGTVGPSMDAFYLPGEGAAEDMRNNSYSVK